MVRALERDLWRGLSAIVSILVVLDHWFGLANAGWGDYCDAPFQSLLFWIIGSGQLAGRAAVGGRRRFQSLLFWIIGSGKAEHWTPFLSSYVSILVVLDHWFGLKSASTQPGQPRCFNPCCFGSLVRARVSCCRHPRVLRVSILVVLDHWFGLVQLPDAMAGIVVSILVVLDHWFGQEDPELYKATVIEFQSLLFWIIGSGVPVAPPPTMVVMVSILVVLDHWFGLTCQYFTDIGIHWFQSLLFWIIGSGQNRLRRSAPACNVSILVVLDHWFGLF